ncbi:Glycosyltransferase, catalytic subunit of cellulose synthase and poly-beta-1,6-N-acetylglucosamine synthase [Quadrisphaera granulorum]|uniref:Cellulose synthase/poly-beta-1,6-N-acetylglucosamine synthase-like glycosyltransferase n=1 Tax=Quadrisphaera granulorum TaxID=317664 RepID=A0A316AGM3_9ACTN|nr:glycosyltransferase family 2 protein [Quadrisphaera granulorum]PWJ56090.1 cellulose synthase/poly-beta-1,6-N-acetylglucosamine synthase-like glycosyltransferase [Quadrisphaera granulorum]SZE94724.1 Glycosyltransferase, catalytic subunit of cellulose synthase and poly-beta-1,6-N-acetylglucosamine synthase [Quadrisphaera granulorum]
MSWVDVLQLELLGGTVRGTVAVLVQVLALPVLLYVLAINSSYLVLIGLAGVDMVRYLRRERIRGVEDASASPLTQSVSVVMAAYNEEAGIVGSVSAMLALRHPRHEVVVVDDGSTDATFALLREAFDLVEVPRRLPDDLPVRARIRSVHVPRGGRSPLVVVRKDNGGRADATNVGVNAARHDLVCFVDADSVLDPDALLTVSRPFADDPVRVVATAGAVRAVNGSTLVGGRVADVRMPRGWTARFQVVEYLRAFCVGRAGWSRMQSLILISGAFGMYRRDVVVEVGGMDTSCIGEDFELTLRLHRHMRRTHREYRVVFVPEPASWTEVPATRTVLARQRRRWQRGLAETLWRHRGMIGNPRYGRIGLVALPYFVLFELVAPVIELVGVVLAPLAVAFGLVPWQAAAALALLCFGYAAMVTVAALLVEEVSFHRSQRWRDLGRGLVAAVLENFGHRQLTALWRVQGLWSLLRGQRQVWGAMDRQGLAAGGAASAGTDVVVLPETRGALRASRADGTDRADRTDRTDRPLAGAGR